jgi:hypothetical protein
MDDFASDTDSDYTSYWRDWVSSLNFSTPFFPICLFVGGGNLVGCCLDPRSVKPATMPTGTGNNLFVKGGVRNDGGSRAGWVL